MLHPKKHCHYRENPDSSSEWPFAFMLLKAIHLPNILTIQLGQQAKEKRKLQILLKFDFLIFALPIVSHGKSSSRSSRSDLLSPVC